MPVWAQIVLPVVVFGWAFFLVTGWIGNIRSRRQQAETFMEWMVQDRDRRA